MKKRILFYSSVGSLELFKTQKFYQIDIALLGDLGYDVSLSNRILDSLLFWKYDILFSYFYRYSFIIRKSKFPQNPKRSVRFSGKRTKRSVQKRKARNTQKAETKVL